MLHTSDWHLGHRLYERERREEQALALDWLLETIKTEGVELLIVAGDIFDLTNPPNYAREQYYDFLGRLRSTSCRQVIIIGGNHDSPSMLDAPAALFRHFSIHVVGGATGNLEDEIIPIPDEKGEVAGHVAAVPFLRDRDLHYSLAGESAQEREKRLQQGIRDHYHAIADLLKDKPKFGPYIATGHLYARGAESAARQDNIYIGSRENILAEQFPAIFDYVALGHIHRPQTVGGMEKIRYSGSLLPLDFSETVDDKSVVLIDFGASSFHPKIIDVPSFRRLKSIRGSLDEVKDGIERFLAKRHLEEVLTPWLEIRVETDKPIPGLREILEGVIDERPAELLAVRLERKQNTGQLDEATLPDLDELDPEQVFLRLIKGDASEEVEGEENLLGSFKELQNWMQEQDNH